MMLRIARRGQNLSRSLKAVISLSPSSQLPAPRIAFQLSSGSRRVPSSLRQFSSTAPRGQLAYATQETQETAPSDTPPELTTFRELADHGLISPNVINVITKEMNIHTMTHVQRLTINECLDGTDVIAQAKTGTGKTLAFLMPIVQRILRDPDLERRSRARAGVGDIRALIISPTRELAEQIATEANKIVRNTNVRVQTAVGGTQKSRHLRLMQQQGCHILVGTPGRVQDLLSDPSTGVRLDNIETFVLDEADRLLDIGFAPAIAEIEQFMPPRSARERQTLMFSATVPKEVVGLVRQILRPDFKFIRTVDPDESPTHERIPQYVSLLNGLENQLPVILELATRSIAEHRADPQNVLPFKAIVYFGSTSEVALACEVFQKLQAPGSSIERRGFFTPHPLSPLRIVQMHSKLSQSTRTGNSSIFRNAKEGILFSSDVTSRGMDFPNVSHVIQIGLPRQPDDYVHRVGRTGRAGKPGQGWLLIQEDEGRVFRRMLANRGLNIKQDTSLQAASLDMKKPAQLPQNIANVLSMVESGIRATSYNIKDTCYSSLLGVLSQSPTPRSKQTIIDMLNNLARYGWGLEKPPALSQSLANKLGFGGCNGVELKAGYGGGFGGDRSFGRGRGDSFGDKGNPFGDRQPIDSVGYRRSRETSGNQRSGGFFDEHGSKGAFSGGRSGRYGGGLSNGRFGR